MAGDCGCSSVVVTVSVGDWTSSTNGSSTLASPSLDEMRSARSRRRNSDNLNTASTTYVMVAAIPHICEEVRDTYKLRACSNHVKTTKRNKLERHYIPNAPRARKGSCSARQEVLLPKRSRRCARLSRMAHIIFDVINKHKKVVVDHMCSLEYGGRK